MAVETSKSGGIRVTISGDLDQFKKDLAEGKRLAGMAANDISGALSHALEPKQTAAISNNIAKYFDGAKRAAQAASADLSVYDQHFKNIGKSIGVNNADLNRFAQVQKQAFQTQSIKQFKDYLEGIQRLTGLTNEEMNELSRSLGGTGNEFTKMAQAMEVAEEKTETFRDKLLTFGKAVGVVGLAYKALNATFGAMKESFLDAARYETLGVVLSRVGANANYSAYELSEYVNQLRQTGIAGLEARSTMTQMIQAQLDLSKSSELARVAQNAAVIANINSSEAFERIVQGIQSASVQTLRTVGINVNFERSYRQLAEAIGKTVTELTEAEKAQARFDGVLASGEQIAGAYEASMETVGKQISSLRRIWSDFSVDAGKLAVDLFEDSGAAENLSSLIQFLNGATLLLQGLNEGLSARELHGMWNVESWGEWDLSGLRAGIEALPLLEAGLEQATVDLDALWALIGDMPDMQPVFNQYSRELANVRLGFMLNKDAALEWLTVLDALMKSMAETRMSVMPFDFDTAISSLEELGDFANSTVLSGTVANRIKALDAEFDPIVIKYQEIFTQAGIDLRTAISQGLPEGLEGLAPHLQKYIEIVKEYGEQSNKILNPQSRSSSGIKTELREAENAIKSLQQYIDKINKFEMPFDERLTENLLKAADAAAKLGWSTERTTEFLEKLQDAMYAEEIEQSLQKWQEDRASMLDMEIRYAQAFGDSQRAQELALEKQREEWIALGNEIENTADRVRYFAMMGEILEYDRKAIEAETNLWAGLKQAVQKHLDDISKVGAEAGKVVDATVSASQTLLTNFIVSGEIQLKQFLESMANALAQFAAQQLIIAPLLGLLGGGTPKVGKSILSKIFSAQGNAFSAGTGLSSYRNSVVSTPTVFPFAKGIGLMGEKAGSPGEAILPLTRTSSGNLGVEANVGSGGGAGDIYVGFGDINIEVNAEGQNGEELSADIARTISTQMQYALNSAIDKRLLDHTRSRGMLAPGIV